MPRRRAPGEGSIHLRKDTGRYRAMLVTGYNESGNPRRRCKDFDSAAEARAWLAEQQLKFGRGELYAANLTVAEMAEEWLASKSDKAAGTVDSYNWITREHIKPRLGKYKLAELRPLHVRRFIADLQKELTPYMVHKVHSYLSMILNEAVRLELAPRNVAAHVRPPKPARGKLESWDDDEVERVLEVCLSDGQPLGAYVYLGLMTGLRREELLGLRWQDVRLDECWLEVRQVVVFVRGKAIVKEPKNENAGRVVTFDPATAQVLLRHKEQLELLRQAAKRWEENDLVFPSTVGTPIGTKTLQRWYGELVAEAGVRRIRPYDLRSTHGSVLAKHKVSPKAISERLGHADVRFTFATYIRPQRSEQREIADMIGSLYRSNQVQPGADEDAKHDQEAPGRPSEPGAEAEEGPSGAAIPPEDA